MNMKKKQEIIQEKINSITRELKECTNDSRYESLWNERLDLKEELEKLTHPQISDN